MLFWLFLPLASGWWWDEKMDVNKRVQQQEEEDLDDYLEENRGEVALERMDLGEYAYYYYEYPEDRQAGELSNQFLSPSNLRLCHRLILLPLAKTRIMMMLITRNWAESAGCPDRTAGRARTDGGRCLRRRQPSSSQTGRHHHHHPQ